MKTTLMTDLTIQQLCEGFQYNGIDGNGKPTSFTPEEAEKLKGALFDLSHRIRVAAESI